MVFKGSSQNVCICYFFFIIEGLEFWGVLTAWVLEKQQGLLPFEAQRSVPAGMFQQGPRRVPFSHLV